MTICAPCANAADGLDYGTVLVCPSCGVGPITVYRTDKTLSEQSVVRHKRVVRGDGDQPVKVWCDGSGYAPHEQTGHDFCNGCACQHRPKGSWHLRSQ